MFSATETQAMHESTARLYLAAERIRKIAGQTNLANLLNQSPQVVKNWESRGVSKAGAVIAQRTLGVSPAWLLHNEGEMLPESTPPSIAGEAHLMTLYARTVPPTVTWEWVMQAAEPLMTEFRLVAADDALAPKAPRGTLLEFSTAMPPRYGHGVLVEDSAGRRYLRVYVEGHAGQWRAAPLNAAYATLESDRDGLKVLAALAGIIDGQLL